MSHRSRVRTPQGVLVWEYLVFPCVVKAVRCFARACGAQPDAPHCRSRLRLTQGKANAHARRAAIVDTLGVEPRAFRMQSGCDTTTPCARVVGRLGRDSCRVPTVQIQAAACAACRRCVVPRPGSFDVPIPDAALPGRSAGVCARGLLLIRPIAEVSLATAAEARRRLGLSAARRTLQA